MSLPACNVDCLGNVYVNRAERYGIKIKSTIFVASVESAAASPFENLILKSRIVADATNCRSVS